MSSRQCHILLCYRCKPLLLSSFWFTAGWFCEAYRYISRPCNVVISLFLHFSIYNTMPMRSFMCVVPQTLTHVPPTCFQKHGIFCISPSIATITWERAWLSWRVKTLSHLQEKNEKSLQWNDSRFLRNDSCLCETIGTTVW